MTIPVARGRQKATLAVTIAALVAIIAAACGGGEPQDRRFSVQFTGGEPVGGVKTLAVNQGDDVTIEFASDIAGTFHLHGYDMETEVDAGGKGTLTLKADATGRFAIEVEELGSEVAFLEVRPG